MIITDKTNTDNINQIKPEWLQNRSRFHIPLRKEIIKAIACPFPRRLNPHANEVAKQSHQWLAKFFKNTPFIKLAAKARIPELSAGFYPEAGFKELKMVTDYLFCIFFLDDVGDESDVGRNPVDYKNLVTLFGDIEMLLNGEKIPNNTNPVLAAIDDTLSRLACFATNEQLSRFAMANREYFDGVLWEVGNRVKCKIPTVKDFQKVRPRAGAIRPFFELISPINSIHLPDEIREDPKLQSLETLAGRVMCWINDLLSYEKEKKCCDIHNLVIVIENNKGISTGEAFRDAVTLCNAEIGQFIKLSNTLPDFRDYSRDIQRYRRTLESMIRITLDWTAESSRYQG